MVQLGPAEGLCPVRVGKWQGDNDDPGSSQQEFQGSPESAEARRFGWEEAL